MRTDAVVLGAGIVGVSTALHLQARGRDVVIVDRTGVAAETSFGNAGLIERSSIMPYAFPRDLALLMRYALNRQTDARFHVGHLPRVAGWLFSYWRHSAPRRHLEASRAMLPLIERCVAEHDVFTTDAGTARFQRRTGWIEAYRSPRTLAVGLDEAAALEGHGLAWDRLDGAALRAREPHLGEALEGGIHWRDPVSISDPAGLVNAYADLFRRRGGRIVVGDARTLAASGDGYVVTTDDGPLSARDAVVALGPWSDDVTRTFGYRIPLQVKRGYHMHYAAGGNAGLAHPVLDADAGYVLAPMDRGIRLTTGVEFAPREAPPTPVQVDASERRAREIFPLGRRLDPKPWMGRRPALPDMRPVIGPAPRHRGLWMAFGHAHHGLTLGPVTGRLLAELITGETPFADPAPYSPARFA